MMRYYVFNNRTDWYTVFANWNAACSLMQRGDYVWAFNYKAAFYTGAFICLIDLFRIWDEGDEEGSKSQTGNA